MSASTVSPRSSSLASNVRAAVPQVIEGFNENDLLTLANAIAFRILFAAVPFALFALALAGFLQLGDVWALAIAPQIQPFLTPAMFAVLNETIVPVLAVQTGFWLTFGGLFAVWEISSAVRGLMAALNRVYGCGDRPYFRSMGVSILLAFGVGACLGLAVLAESFGPLDALGLEGGVVAGSLDFVVRWGLAVALLLAAIAMLVRFGPSGPQPLAWVSVGSGLTVLMWIVVSLGFVWYVTAVAPYTTLFGSLAAFIVLMTYLDLSCIAFLLGVQLDAVIRRQVEGTASPEE